MFAFSFSLRFLQPSDDPLYQHFTDSFEYQNAEGFVCLCAAGFNGETCENNIDDCSPDMPPETKCFNGRCVDGVNKYTCDCFNGYSGDQCETDIDECK